MCRPQWPALVLELLPRGSLHDLLYLDMEGRAPLSLALKHRLVLEVAQGLEYLHEKNVLHRDIKTVRRVTHVPASRDAPAAKLEYRGEGRGVCWWQGGRVRALRTQTPRTDT